MPDTSGCRYRETINRYSEATDNTAVQNGRIAPASAEARTDWCRSITRPETGACPMAEASADRLALATAQLQVNADKIIGYDFTEADLPCLTTYLDALTDHCHQISERALRTVENAEKGRPFHSGPHGIDLQSALGQAMALFDASLHFVGDAKRNLPAIHRYGTP